MRTSIATLNHIHPDFTLFNKSRCKGFSSCILGAENARFSTGLEKIFQCFPGKLMRELERLNKSLFLEFRKVAFFRYFYCAL